MLARIRSAASGPLIRPFNPAAFAIALTRRPMADPERTPNTGPDSSPVSVSARHRLSARVAACPMYWIAPAPSWSVLLMRTVSRAEPSGRKSTSPHVSAAASLRRSSPSNMEHAKA